MLKNDQINKEKKRLKNRIILNDLYSDNILLHLNKFYELKCWKEDIKFLKEILNSKK